MNIGQTVLYKGRKTTIDHIYTDGTVRIVNPFWDWDEEAECVNEGINYDVPYWITVMKDELTVKMANA
jgi:hypothetical protein